MSDQEYAAVFCNGDSVEEQQSCGQVKISRAEYVKQMNRPDLLWVCPSCGSTATLDDKFYEELHLGVK